PTACPAAHAPTIPPIPPLSLDEVRPVRGLSGRVGATAAALGMTVDDGRTALVVGSETGRITLDRRRRLLRLPGLRAGTLTEHIGGFSERAAAYTLHYVDDQFVPGVRLDGTVHVRAAVRGEELGPLHL